jgi:glucokinase
MLLCGDIGGTKTLLGLFSPGGLRPLQVHVQAYPTLGFTSLGKMLEVFLEAAGLQRGDLRGAGFGVAGPVLHGVARLTNVPWFVDAGELAEQLRLSSVRLLNDMEAMANAVTVLEEAEVAVLQKGTPVAGGNKALIAAGTGLGVALLANVERRFVAIASEGGHADFAARNARELAFVEEFSSRLGRVDCEAVLSGPGLMNLFRFLHGRHSGDCTLTEEPLTPPAITASAMEGNCLDCVETLDMFVSAYGSEAGNIALGMLATGGVYVGGGIAPKILPALQSGEFMRAFTTKEPMTELLESIPVSVILNEETALVGASVVANRSVVSP